jgi:uncharacterized membrane protein YdbT with pleckstrin-like domain
MTPNTRYLIADEQPVLETRRHFTVLLGPASQALLAVWVASLLSAIVGRSAFSTILWWLTVPFLVRLVWKMVDWAVDRIVVTDRRIFEVSGIFVRKVAMMPLKRITDLTYEQSLLGRMLGYGEVILESAGQDQALSRLTHLPEPDSFYKTLTRLSLR